MSPLEIVAILLSGVAAGAINTVVGSGTLVTFPVLLAFGVPPVTANVSNTIGLVPGSASGAWGYRRELRGQRDRLVRLGAVSIVGGLAGAVLLLVLPSESFTAIVPVLIVLGIVLLLLGPRVSALVAARRTTDGPHPDHAWVPPAMFGIGVYGGYFGAAYGVLTLAVLGVGVDDDLHRHNALKNVTAALVNGVAAIVFAFAADVDWTVAGTLALGAVIGGQIGAHVGRRLPPPLLRAVIVVVAVVALVVFLT